MGEFLRTDLSDEWSFVRGAARLLVAPLAQAFPSNISDVVELASGATQYDVVADWTDLGATKTGISISVNHAEETFDVDQIIGDIDSVPVNWECSVQSALAENTLEHMQLAWEGSAISVDTGVTPNERTMGYGQSDNYTERRLAVLFKSSENLIRAVVFRRVQLMPVESSISFNKTGEQAQIPIQFKGLSDSTEPDIQKRYFSVIEQIS